MFIFTFYGCKEKIIETKNETGIWTKIESGITNALYDIDFIDEKNGWIVGDGSVIIHTKDGGDSWQLQLCPAEEILWAVDFIDTENGWICSQNSILKTTDGGENWEIKYNENLGEGRFRDIKFLNRDKGFVVGGRGSFGANGILLTTEDGGETWTQTTINNLSTLTHISIVDEGIIWICGYGGTTLSSKDKGYNWYKNDFNFSPAPSLTSIQFIDNNFGYTSSRDDYLGFYITTDGGISWTQVNEEGFKIIGGVQAFIFITQKKGWLCNFPFGRLLKTEDGGKSWNYDSEFRERINSFHFINSGLGWGVGSKGYILKYSINN